MCCPGLGEEACTHRHTLTGTHTDTQTDTHRDTHTDTQTDRHTQRHTDTETHRHTLTGSIHIDTQTHRQTHTDRHTQRHTHIDTQTQRHTDTHTGTRTHTHRHTQTRLHIHRHTHTHTHTRQAWEVSCVPDTKPPTLSRLPSPGTQGGRALRRALRPGRRLSAPLFSAGQGRGQSCLWASRLSFAPSVASWPAPTLHVCPLVPRTQRALLSSGEDCRAAGETGPQIRRGLQVGTWSPENSLPGV